MSKFFKRFLAVVLSLLLAFAALPQVGGVAHAAVSFILVTAERTSLANKLNDDLDDGSLKIYTAADGLLSTHTLPDKASNSVANGVLTFGAISNVNASGSGDASYFTLCNVGGTELCRGNVGTAATTLILNTVTIVSGGPVAITSLTVTVPAGS